MKALTQQAAALEHSNRALALDAVRLIDEFKQVRSPKVLQALQSALVSEHQHANARVDELRIRDRSRTARIKRRFGSNAQVHGLRKEHGAAVATIRSLWGQRQDILYQVGDAAAWVAAGGDPRPFAALAGPEPENQLPKGVGLAGPMKIAERAHLDGRFLVVLNDLTRCVARGDLSVFHQGRPDPPVVLELKTTLPDQERRCLIGLHAYTLEVNGTCPLFHEFSSALGLEAAEPPALDTRGERQLSGLEAAAERTLQAITGQVPYLEPGAQTTWSMIEDLLTDATEAGVASRVLDGGIVALAVTREMVGENPPPDLKAYFNRFVPETFEDGRRWEYADLRDLIGHRGVSAHVPPVLIWDVAPAHRAALLCGDLRYLAFWHSEMWSDALGTQGVALDCFDDHWSMRAGGATMNLTKFEVAKMVLGVGFAGVSLVGLASEIAGCLGREAERLGRTRKPQE